MTKFEQLKPDQQRVAYALFILEQQQDQWISGYYKAITKEGKPFQGKGVFNLGNCILESKTTYEFVSPKGTYYTVSKTNSRWIPTPIPPIQKDHLI